MARIREKNVKDQFIEPTNNEKFLVCTYGLYNETNLYSSWITSSIQGILEKCGLNDINGPLTQCMSGYKHGNRDGEQT